MRIALVGNQNSGKTSLFNALTGAHQKVGNWPGVTIERKEGRIKGSKHTLIDLPGIYSLSPYSPEEEVSRQYAVEEKPDIIINIIDATSLERSLYLTTQLLELDCKVIIALNMSDLLDKKGIKIDSKALEEALHTTVVEVSALKGTGIDKLIKIINENQVLDNVHLPIYATDIEKSIKKIEAELEGSHQRFVAVKLLERDPRYQKSATDLDQQLIKEIEEKYGLDTEEIIANQRYDFITELRKKVCTFGPRKVTITDRLDKVFLNKFAALPIFAAIMFLIYFLSVGVVGSATVGWIEELMEGLSEWVSGALENGGASEWSISLVVDGVIAGVGAILSFVPQLIILFLCICLLETTGYMSRITFFLDRLFRKIGLSGKALIPFIVGTGCSVPGVMAARAIENAEEKKMTVILTPFIPCSAKLPIIALFAGHFFGPNSGIVSASLYFFAVIVIILLAYLLRKFVFKGENSSYISELPEYKLPNFKYLFRDVSEKTLAFIKRAGTIILLCSIVIWVLLSFNWKFEYGVEVADSILASIGNALAWLFYPMIGHWSWEATVSAVQGLVAKEQVVSSMAIIAGLSEDVTEGHLILAEGGAFGYFNSVSAYAFMVFNLFSAPCFGALGAMKRELGGTKAMLKAAFFQTGIAWVLAILVFLVGSLLTGGF
ncbi:MAG: ferrous iron transport protein B [Bacilli bacterium]|jgi:ferrous iron transport protein B